MKIETLEGTMTASKGDYIIKGVNDEFYPCKLDIFQKTYEFISGNLYKKKPITINAKQYNGSNELELRSWIKEYNGEEVI